MKSRLTKFLRTCFGVCVLIVLAPVLLPMIAIAFCILVYDKIRLKRFRKLHDGRVFLICSRRRDWEPVLQNNVIPILPEEVTAVWIESPHPWQTAISLARSNRAWVSKPFLLRITRLRIESVSLNQALQQFKSHSQPAAETQRDVEETIRAAMQSLTEKPAAEVSL